MVLTISVFIQRSNGIHGRVREAELEGNVGTARSVAPSPVSSPGLIAMRPVRSACLVSCPSARSSECESTASMSEVLTLSGGKGH